MKLLTAAAAAVTIDLTQRVAVARSLNLDGSGVSAAVDGSVLSAVDGPGRLVLGDAANSPGRWSRLLADASSSSAQWACWESSGNGDESEEQ